MGLVLGNRGMKKAAARTRDGENHRCRHRPWRRRLRMVAHLGGLATLAAVASSCHSKPTLWVYTSLYKEVVAEMKPAVDRAFPEVDVRWYQGGSENVAARVNTELFAGRTQADLILTSDPFWYLELKKNGKLAAYDSPAVREVSNDLKDPDHAFATVRIPAMVLAYNSDALSAPQAPASWEAFRSGEARWKDRLSMGSPLESGTSFTAVALLSKKFGWEYFATLRRLDIIAAGGNSSVINRMETRERPIGVVLLENVLKARKKGSPIQPVYPEDGVIPVPSPIAITADSREPERARRLYDWFFTDEAQKAIVRAGM
jgi:iron(III) transport system substrate-binding protein